MSLGTAFLGSLIKWENGHPAQGLLPTCTPFGLGSCQRTILSRCLLVAHYKQHTPLHETTHKLLSLGSLCKSSHPFSHHCYYHDHTCVVPGQTLSWPHNQISTSALRSWTLVPADNTRVGPSQRILALCLLNRHHLFPFIPKRPQLILALSPHPSPPQPAHLLHLLQNQQPARTDFVARSHLFPGRRSLSRRSLPAIFYLSTRLL